MANFIKYATAAAAGYAWRAYSQRNTRAPRDLSSPLAGIVTSYLVERIFNAVWPEKPQPQEYRKVPFSDHYVRYDQPQSGFYNLYQNFRKR